MEEIETNLPDHTGKSYDEIGTPCCLLSGAAGSGKSYSLNKALEENPKFALLTSTTGISAINLGCVTINSVLGYFNETTIHNDEFLKKRLRKIKTEKILWLVVDEFSMWHKQVLDTIYQALDEVNSESSSSQPLGLMLAGDELQLPPVQSDAMVDGRKVIDQKTQRPQKAQIPWPFDAVCFPKFLENEIKLTKIWRQSEPRFLSALSEIRKGNGAGGASLLKLAGVRFSEIPDQNFTGTVIVGTNAEADKINLERLKGVEGESFKITSDRWWARKYQPQEWKFVPEEMELKIGAQVMILANDSPQFRYVNGDVGVVEKVIYKQEFDYEDLPNDMVRVCNIRDGTEIVDICVKLQRSGEFVTIPKITRHIWQYSEPHDWEIKQDAFRVIEGAVPGVRRKVWILGELTYFPIRLAYSSTIHRVQGLTLDKIEVRIGGWFMGQPQMIYTALSRCKTAEGISIIGSPSLLAKRVRIHDEVRRFL